MSVPEIDVDELARLREQGAAVLDVRSPEEWERVRLPGVPLIPLGELVERADEAPEGEPLYVICGSGPRSARAVEYLRGVGREAVNVAGGTKAWIEAGLPTESGPE